METLIYLAFSKAGVSQYAMIADPLGRQFATALQQELERINAFYIEQEQELEVTTSPRCRHDYFCAGDRIRTGIVICETALFLQAVLADSEHDSQSWFAQFRAEVTDLRKFVVLNYIAVIKAVKKRNRHLQVGCLC